MPKGATMADKNDEPVPGTAGEAGGSEEGQPDTAQPDTAGTEGDAGADSGLVVSLEPEPGEPAEEPEEPEKPAEEPEVPAEPAEPTEPAAEPETHATLW
jgi:hypothetical protein